MTIKHKQNGFTLIEILTVIAIIGVLIAIVAPGIVSTLPNYRLRGEIRELKIDFKKAKLAAVKHNRDVIIEFVDAVAGSGGSYKMFVNMDKDPAPYSLDAGDITLIDKQIRQEMKLTNTFTNNQAGYNSRGLPLSIGDVVIELGDDSKKYTLNVSSAGNVRLQ
jgi:prepilin-type N-terminal cleavage/methylation domain-containing protein